MKYNHLYIAWGVLFALTAVLGFLPTPEGAAGSLLQLLSVVFFLPPCWILVKARKEGAVFHIRLIRNLSLAWIAATAGLLCANLMSVNWSNAVGNALHALLTVVSAPLVCSKQFILPIFLWGMLLTGALSLLKKKT